MVQKAVSYIDLLGFSDAVQNNPEGALLMLSHFNSIVNSLNFERAVHPSHKYISNLQGLASRTSNESFEHFMPFSDSVFIVSKNCSDFVLQLGNFVKESFMFNSHVFVNSDDPNDPTAYHSVGIDSSDPNNIHQISIPYHECPVLFRGGISFGNVIETEQKGVFNNRVASYKNLMGEAVVHAVKLEGLKREDGTKIKGPRLVLNSSVYEQLNKETKLYVRQLPEDKNYYEILWPAMGYILENKDTFDQEFNHFDELFNPAFNLWKYYKAKDVANNTEVKIHYERFLELIVASAIRIYNYMGMKNSVLQNLSTIIKNKFSNDDRICIFEGVVENSLT